MLGSTGATTIHRDFAGADYPGTWYVQSLANKLAGADQQVGTPDMNTQFNSALNGAPTCLGGVGWYYGIDGLEGVNIELLPVVLHELAHGLGFATTTNGSTGAYNLGFPSIYDRYLMDNTLGLHWIDMTAAQRAASAISIDKLVWDGFYGTTAADAYLAHRRRMLVTAPAGIAGSYGANTASFGPQSFTVSGNVVLMDDGTGTTSDGCEPLINGPALAGNIALVDRGTCTFASKAAAAQAAGAIAVLIANNVAGPLSPGGTDPTIVIPVVGITQADGATLKANLGSGVSVTLDLDPTLMAGADPAGRPLMYAPNPFQGGSSVSHWDVTMTPNTLMEPAINGDLHDGVDITTALFRDIGWFPMVTATTLAEFLAEGRDDGIQLRWRFSEPGDVLATRVERGSSAQGPWTTLPLAMTITDTHVEAFDADAPVGQTSYYRLGYQDAGGSWYTTGLVFAARRGSVASTLQLSAPTPNPTTRGSVVTFSVPTITQVRLTVCDASGRRIRTLQDGSMMPGQYSRTWDGRTDRDTQAAAGVYFYHLETSDGAKMQRVAIVR